MQRYQYQSEYLKKKKKYLLDMNVPDNQTFRYSVAAGLTQALQCELFQLPQDPGKYARWEKYLQCSPSESDVDEEDLVKAKEHAYQMNQSDLLWGLVQSQKVNLDFDVHLLVLGLDGLLTMGPKNVVNPAGEIRKTILNILQVEVIRKSEDGVKRMELRYMLVKDLRLFLNGQGQSHRKFCTKCQRDFWSYAAYRKHTLACDGVRNQIIKMPTISEDGSLPVMKFKKFSSLEPMNIVGYFDFEAAIAPTATAACTDCMEDQSSLGRCKCPKSGNAAIATHDAVCYSFVFIDGCNNILFEETKVCYEGKAAVKMLERWLELEPLLWEKMKEIKPLKMTSSDWKTYYASTHCGICQNKFSSEQYFPSKDVLLGGLWTKNMIVRHHNHGTGKFVSACCKECNLLVRRQRTIKCFAHNCFSYDANFLIAALQDLKDITVDALPLTKERLRCLKINSFEICDSMNHLKASLGSLSSSLMNTDHEYGILKQSSLVHNKEEDFDPKRLSLLLKKSIFPYELMTNVKRLEEFQCIPDKALFFSSLTNSIPVSDEDYQNAQTVFDYFECKNMVCFLKIYSLLDSLILAEIMDKYRKKMHFHYGIDPVWYISVPSFSLQAFLYHSRCSLELLTSQEKYEFLQNNLRGGISTVNLRYAETTLDEKLVYLDVNNLYGAILSGLLPVSGFEWESIDRLKQIDWKNIDTETDEGWIVEVTLHYPESLHQHHSQLPLAPIQLPIDETMMSPYQRKALTKIGKKEKFRERRLALPVCDRKNYVLHFKLLKLYLQLGLEIISVHRGLRFKQAEVAKSYLQLNTRLRKESQYDYDKSMFKLLSNALYGKTAQRAVDGLVLRVVKKQQKFEKYLQDPNLVTTRILGDNLMLMFMRQMEIQYDKLPHIALTVLDCSKAKIYHDFYCVFLTKWPRLELCFHDTDSFFMKVQTKDLDKDLLELADIMDFSSYDKDDPMYDASRKNELGYYKNEVGSSEITRYVGLKAKCYAFQTKKNGKDSTVKKHKGVQKHTISRSINFNDYMACLFHSKSFMAKFNRIVAKQFQITTVTSTKLALSNINISKYFFCPLHSAPFYSKEIATFEEFGVCPKCPKCK